MEAGAIFAVTLGIYASGACPTMYVGDSGELVSAVTVLGIPHPPGYPLYVLAGKLFTHLVPVGTVAYRMGLFSALFAALAVAVVHLLARLEGWGRMAALLATALLLGSGSFWGEGNVPRVYSLNAFFLALVLLLARSWQRTSRPGRLTAALFLGGLGASNHAYMALATAAALVTAAAWDRQTRRARRLAALLVAFGAGLMPYLYLPIRSRADPPLDWGNPESLRALRAVLLREDFWQRAWVESWRDLATVAGDYLRSFPIELGWAGTILALLGVSTLARRERGTVLVVLAMVANVAAVALHGSRADIFVWHRYYIPSYLLAALLAGRGGALVAARLPRVGRGLLALALAATVAGYPAVYRASDRSRYRIADSFGRALLASLPPGAHLSATDDNVLFVLMYLQMVEGVRPDVDLIQQGIGGADLPPLRFDPDRDALFFTHGPNWRRQPLAAVPVGLAFRVVRAGSAPPPRLAMPEALAGERDAAVPRDYLTRSLLGHFHLMRALTLEPSDWPRSRLEIEEAARVAFDDEATLYNAGLVCARNGLHRRAAELFADCVAISDRPLPSPSHPRARDRLEEELAAARAARGPAGGDSGRGTMPPARRQGARHP